MSKLSVRRSVSGRASPRPTGDAPGHLNDQDDWMVQLGLQICSSADNFGQNVPSRDNNNTHLSVLVGVARQQVGKVASWVLEILEQVVVVVVVKSHVVLVVGVTVGVAPSVLTILELYVQDSHPSDCCSAG